MIATMIMTLMLIGIVGNLMFYSFSYYNTSSKRNAIEENDRAGLDAKNILIQNIYQIDGRSGFYAPLGDLSDNGWTTLPSFFGSKRYNTNGIPFLYCPFSNDDSGVTGTKTTMPDDTTYSVSTVSNPSKSGYPYVVESSYQNNSLIAAIVSPIGNDNTPPNCYDIEYSNGVYSVPDGQVWAINELDVISGGSITSNSYSNTTQNVYVTSEATSADVSNGGAGEGDNSDSSVSYSSQSLVTNIERFKNSDIEEMRLYLGSGTYTISDENIDLFVDDDEFFNSTDRKLVLFGSSSERPTIVNESGNELEFYMPNIQLEMNNINFDTHLNIQGNTFIGEDSKISRVTGYNGDLTFKDFEFDDIDYSENISLISSKAQFYGNIDAVKTIEFDNGSVVNFNNVDLDIIINKTTSNAIPPLMIANGSYGVFDNTQTYININGVNNAGPYNLYSTLLMRNSEFILEGKYVYTYLSNSGENIIYGTSFSLNGTSSIGIHSFQNSEFDIDQSEMFTSGDTPLVGFNDSGNTLSIGGGNAGLGSTNFTAGNCFAGDIFSTATGSSSSPTTEDYKNKNNSSAWNCI